MVASMDVSALAALEHENLLSADGAVAGRIGGSVVRRADGVALFATGLPLRVFNVAFVDGGTTEPAAIGAAVEVLRARGAPFALCLRAGIDDEHVATATALGLALHDEDPWMPGMALHPIPPDIGPLPSALDVRPATDAPGIADHVTAAAEGFGMPREWLVAGIDERLLDDPAVTVYTGYEDGRPAVAGMSVRTGRTIGIYNIATIPSARRRGHGATMTRRILADALATGCDVAILQSSDMGRPVYEALGFREVVAYRAFIDPEP
jgi:GNAT superfamily N-acetyltransferase